MFCRCWAGVASGGFDVVEQPVIEPTASAAAEARAMSLVFIAVPPSKKTAPRYHIGTQRNGDSMSSSPPSRQRIPESPSRGEWNALEPGTGRAPTVHMVSGVILVPSRLTLAISPPLVR